MQDRFRWATLLTAALVYGTIVMGGYVTASGSGLGCSHWPGCEPDHFFPALGDPHAVIEWTHRTFAFFTGIALLGVFAWAVKEKRSDRRLFQSVTFAFLLLPVQAGLGAVTVFTGLNPAIAAMHTGTAAALFGSIVAANIFAFIGPKRVTTAGAPSEPAPAPSEPRDARSRAKDYALMVKPGILFLVVLTGLAGLLLAGGSRLSPWTAGITLLGGALSAASANAFNHYLERDVDAQMTRTKKRPLPSQRVPERAAFVFAAAMAVLAFVLLGLLVNLLAAFLSLAGLFFYIGVYTVWLKPRTPQNIVIGGAAGSFPALVGWAAVTGTLAWPAVLLGALVFLWTPPHFWALALVYKEDYARGGFPMMPNVKGEAHTRKEIWAYTLLLVGASLLFVWPLNALGVLYLAAALVLGGLFCWYAWRLLQEPSTASARKLFVFSIWYLLGLFVAIGLDVLAQPWLPMRMF
ncbi:MAG: heme o synthase [Halobacteriales archaeon]|nr:heme o synthase [Halobacteriales archaeon]